MQNMDSFKGTCAWSDCTKCALVACIQSQAKHAVLKADRYCSPHHMLTSLASRYKHLFALFQGLEYRHIGVGLASASADSASMPLP